MEVEIEFTPCNCAVCNVCHQHVAAGVPLDVVMVYATGITIPNWWVLALEDRAARLDEQLAYWTVLRAASEKMIETGVATDDEFRIAMTDPVKAMNLYTKISDYVKSHAH